MMTPNSERAPMQRMFTPLLLLGVALLVVLSPCSEVEHYRLGPAPLEAPERIADADLTFDTSTGSAVLFWTSPRSSDDAGELTRYEIRYIYDAEFDWAAAQSVLDPPVPAAPGQAQEYVFKNPAPGGGLNAAIAAIDDADKSSQHSNVASLHVPGFRFAGRVVDALTHQPLSGIEVDVTGLTVSSRVATDAEGRFELADLRRQRITVFVKNDFAEPQFFDLSQVFDFTSNSDVRFELIPYAKSEVRPPASILLTLRQATGTYTGSDKVFYWWQNLPIPLYVPEFTNAHGLDYRQGAVDAANRWMELTGIDLWELVDEPAPWGSSVFARTTEEMGIHNGITHHENHPDGFPHRSDVEIVDTIADPVKLRTIMLHELGHVLRFEHMPKGFLMYVGQPLPEDPTPDEVLIVRIIHGLANPTDLAIYQEVTP
jgi:hypothetical protein